MLSASLPEQIFDIERFAKTGVEFLDTKVDFGAQSLKRTMRSKSSLPSCSWASGDSFEAFDTASSRILVITTL
jgi:hypothetical protein